MFVYLEFDITIKAVFAENSRYLPIVVGIDSSIHREVEITSVK